MALMKGLLIFLIIFGGLVGGAFVAINKAVMTQLNALQDFYSNVDKYSAAAISDNSKGSTPPQSLEIMQHPFQHNQH